MSSLAAFGIEKLDELLGGGLERSSLNLLVGRSGAGKTVLASHWAAEGVKNDENVIYLSTTLNKSACEKYLTRFEFMKDAFSKITWVFSDVDARDFLPMNKERFAQKLKEIVGKVCDYERLIFDTVTSFERAFGDPVLYRRALRYLAEVCYENKVTLLIVEEISVNGVFGETVNLSECAIHLDLLRTPTGYERALRIVKRYGHGHPLDWLPFKITNRGIEIGDGRYVRVNYEFRHEPR